MKKTLSVILTALVMFGASVPASAGWFDDKISVVEYGNVDTLATALTFFRPNGGTSTAVTYTASTIVGTGIYVKKIIWNMDDEDLAGAWTLWDTDTTTVSANAKKVKLFNNDASAADNLNAVKELDLTMGGSSKGIWIKNYPAVLDSGGNTVYCTILYEKAPRNKTQP